MRRSAAWLAVVLGSSCSFVDTHFNECKTDSDCASGDVCLVDPQNASQHFCVAQTIPAGCLGISDAGILPTYGDLDAGTLHLGAAINFTSTAGIAQNKLQNLNAIVLALNDVNTYLGAGHRTFVLHVCDTANDTTKLGTQVAWMVKQLGVPAVIIPGSGNVISAAQTTVPAGVLIISPTATSPSIAQQPYNDPDSGVRLVWRTAPSDELQGRVIGDLLLGTSAFDGGPNLSALSRVAVMYTNDAYGQGLSAVIQDRFSQSDAGRPFNSFFYTRDGDITAALSQLAAFRPNVTVLISFPEDTPRIINAAAQMPGLGADAGHQWVFTDSAKDPSLISGVNDPAQIATAVGTAPAQNAGPAYPTFASRFENQYGVDPSQYGFTSHSYDAMYLLALGGSYAVGADNNQPFTGARIAQGLIQASSTGTVEPLEPLHYVEARSALQAGQPIDVAGASGNLDFDPATGESTAPIEYWGVTDAGFQTIADIVPPAS